MISYIRGGRHRFLASAWSIAAHYFLAGGVRVDESNHNESTPIERVLKPYEDAFQCLRPSRALRSTLTTTGLELLLLWQANDPQQAMKMITQLTKTKEEGVTLETFQRLMQGKFAEALPAEMLNMWHSVVARACLGLGSADLMRWHGEFAKLDLNGDGYFTRKELETYTPTSEWETINPTKVPLILFGIESPLIEGDALGFYQYAKGTAEFFSHILFNELSDSQVITQESFVAFAQAEDDPASPVPHRRGLSDAALEKVWSGLDFDMDGEVQEGELAKSFFQYFEVVGHGEIAFKTEQEIGRLDRNLKRLVQECEQAVTEECVARTCPKYCVGQAAAAEVTTCSAQCHVDQRCKKWAPTLPAFTNDDTIEKQGFAQLQACVAQKRRTSGYDGGDWNLVVTPSFSKVLSATVLGQLNTDEIERAEDWSLKKSLDLGDRTGIRKAAEEVFLEISAEHNAVENPPLLQEAAHRGWVRYQLQRFPDTLVERLRRWDNHRWWRSGKLANYEKLVEMCLQVLRS